MALRGSIDFVSGTAVDGWAWDPEQPDTPVSLLVLANGAVVGRCLANRLRRDLEAAGIGDGKHAFSLQFHKHLPGGERHSIEVRREDDGAVVPGSPKIVETPLSFDQTVVDELSRIFAAAETDDDFDRRMAFLAEQTEKLKNAFNRKRSGLTEREARQRLQWQDAAGAPGRKNAREARPAALVIDDRLPDMNRDAGSKAIVSHMESLQRLGFDVHFAPADMVGDPGALEAFGVTCHARPWVNSVEELLERQRGAYRLVYLHRLSNASCYMPLTRKFQPRARVIYSLADLHSLRLAREAAVEKRDDLARHSEWLKRQEFWCAAQADAVVTHSPVEKDLLQRNLPAKTIVVAPWRVAPDPTAARFSERNGIGFLAHFAHKPNVDAARLLVGPIMKAVWAKDPTIACTLAGSEMPESLRELAGEKIHVLGAVGELGEFFDRVRLTVAPLAFGAGIKGKVLDSFAAGAPCVCTPVAAEGLLLPPALARFVHAKITDMAEAIVALHNDEKLHRETAAAGLDFIRDYASEAKVDAALAQAADVSPPQGEELAGERSASA
ncbi:glycosyltransferase [Rhodoblastus sp.]|uniref:glycosyltransferase n=1 Tax=Rhodoblastus sp. TaxID=1962975 RepID=UPI003F9A91BE